MRSAVLAALVAAALTMGCSYWSARPAGDAAPATWADATGSASPPAGTDGGERATPAVAGAPLRRPPGARGLEDRLRNLERLHRDGLIGQRDYRERRLRLLQEGFD